MNIAILGGGIEGVSTARYFLRHKTTVTLCDQNKINLGGLKSTNLHLRLGPQYLDNLGSFDLTFRSPGIPFLHPQIQEAIKKGVKFTSLTRYFFERCPCKIVGITGTKGKGTVASLLGEILRSAKIFFKGKIYIGGNMGNPPLNFLDSLRRDDIVILELSSFQLQDIEQSPQVAIILPVSEDHLDAHENFGEYYLAKERITKFQSENSIAIGDIDNKFSRRILENSAGEKLGISLHGRPQNGGYASGNKLYLSRRGKRILLCDFSKTKLIGDHNKLNILCAAAAACALGVPIPAMRKAIENFKGLPYRLEFVRELDGVKYYNDSTSTNPETCIAAIRSFKQPIVLIAGGSDKNLDYEKLGREIVTNLNVKSVILMGATAKRIERTIDQTVAAKAKFNPRKLVPLEVISADSFPEALMAGRAVAQPGDIVLLSPASASFDMFKDYQERGELFSRWVKSL